MWRKVHEADLISSLSLKEVDAYRKSAEFENDPVESQIRNVCAYVRGCIRTGGKLRDDQMAREEDWLPESLIAPAMDYLPFKVLTRMNVVVNDSRTKAYEDASNLFNELKRGEYAPEPDGTAQEDGKKATSPAFSAPRPERLLD